MKNNCIWKEISVIFVHFVSLITWLDWRSVLKCASADWVCQLEDFTVSNERMRVKIINYFVVLLRKDCGGLLGRGFLPHTSRTTGLSYTCLGDRDHCLDFFSSASWGLVRYSWIPQTSLRIRLSPVKFQGKEPADESGLGFLLPYAFPSLSHAAGIPPCSESAAVEVPPDSLHRVWWHCRLLTNQEKWFRKKYSLLRTMNSRKFGGCWEKDVRVVS